ncbi:MAG: hypothetical protein HY749_16385 [Gammaproteobacteria bacterium]|nr:hypothetical protein [Gammaproteobacteria bacterium]
MNKIRPTYPDAVRECQSPTEMRAELSRQRLYSPLVRGVQDAADVAGMSGEDRAIVLAYNLLLENERFRNMVSERVMTQPDPPWIVRA